MKLPNPLGIDKRIAAKRNYSRRNCILTSQAAIFCQFVIQFSVKEMIHLLFNIFFVQIYSDSLRKIKEDTELLCCFWTVQIFSYSRMGNLLQKCKTMNRAVVQVTTNKHSSFSPCIVLNQDVTVTVYQFRHDSVSKIWSLFIFFLPKQINFILSFCV